MERPPASPPSTVDSCLLTTFVRGRLPTVSSGFAVIVAVGFHTGWTTGPATPLIASASLVHAVYERVQPRSDPAIGLGVDVAVGMYIGWLGGLPSMIVALGLLFVVLAAYFHHGSNRRWLLSEIGVLMTGALLTTPPDIGLSTGLATGLTVVVGLGVAASIAAILMLAARQLRKTEVQRGYVLGTVAHELRNDLTSVIGLSTLMADDAELSGHSSQAEQAHMILSQATDAADTVEDLLTVARLDRDALDLHLQPVSLVAELAQVLRRLNATGIAVGSTDSSAFSALADPIRVRQIVRNLATNAQRYGGELIEIDFAVDDAGTHVLVRDSGDGIRPEDLGTVFAPFGRGADGRRHAESVGLGLWIARQLAKAMGGDLTYKRDDGWTVFDLTLSHAA